MPTHYFQDQVQSTLGGVCRLWPQFPFLTSSFTTYCSLAQSGINSLTLFHFLFFNAFGFLQPVGLYAGCCFYWKHIFLSSGSSLDVTTFQQPYMTNTHASLLNKLPITIFGIKLMYCLVTLCSTYWNPNSLKVKIDDSLFFQPSTVCNASSRQIVIKMFVEQMNRLMMNCVPFIHEISQTSRN